MEAALAAAQAQLAQEKQTNAALSSALQSCTEEKAQLQEEKDALINVIFHFIVRKVCWGIFHNRSFCDRS